MCASMLPGALAWTTGAGGSGAPARLPPWTSLNHRVPELIRPQFRKPPSPSRCTPISVRCGSAASESRLSSLGSIGSGGRRAAADPRVVFLPARRAPVRRGWRGRRPGVPPRAACSSGSRRRRSRPAPRRRATGQRRQWAPALARHGTPIPSARSSSSRRAVAWYSVREYRSRKSTRAMWSVSSPVRSTGTAHRRPQR